MTKNNTKTVSQTTQKIKTFDDFDKLNLKLFAESLLQNIEKGNASPIGEQGAYTISLNAEFGNGKTCFLEMFKHFIEDEKTQNYNVISINAWESDFYGEPIISILSELINLVKIQEEGNDKKGNHNKKETITKITKILGKIANHKVTRLIGNIANQFADKKTGFNVKEIIASCNNKNNKPEKWNRNNEITTGQNILTELDQIKKTIKEIKTIISEYTEDKKLLIIIDELDRTRPDYAVHFLENIKHFFDIKNVVFLVAVNRRQMEATVKCLYGQDLNFDGYYRKFFKQEIDLPDPYKEAQGFVDNLIENTKVNFDHQRNDRSYRVNDAYVSCKSFHLTLREIEGFIRVFEQLLASETQTAKWVEMNCYSFFICLFMKEKEKFKKILLGGYTPDDFFEFVSAKNFEYEYEKESDEAKRKEKYGLNYLLGQVSCSFAENREHFAWCKEKIKQKFKAIGDPDRIIEFNHPYLGSIKGLSLDEGQSALRICKSIDQLKPVFKK